MKSLGGSSRLRQKSESAQPQSDAFRANFGDGPGQVPHAGAPLGRQAAPGRPKRGDGRLGRRLGAAWAPLLGRRSAGARASQPCGRRLGGDAWAPLWRHVSRTLHTATTLITGESSCVVQKSY